MVDPKASKSFDNNQQTLGWQSRKRKGVNNMAQNCRFNPMLMNLMFCPPGCHHIKEAVDHFKMCGQCKFKLDRDLSKAIAIYTGCTAAVKELRDKVEERLL